MEAALTTSSIQLWLQGWLYPCTRPLNFKYKWGAKNYYNAKGKFVTCTTPKRSHEHSINLLANTTPIKVRPYKYPYSQKAEIEKLVVDMLAEGVI